MNDPAIGSREAGVMDRATPDVKAPLWARGIATLAGTGYLRPGPGTWGSAVTTVAWFFVARALPAEYRVGTAIGWAALATLIGIPAATREARASGKKDPQHVVVDEMAGQMIALIGAPLAWKSLVASFILFRCFDIVKPPPIRRLEHLPEGSGIVLDDVAAGIYALIVAQVLLRFGITR